MLGSYQTIRNYTLSSVFKTGQGCLDVAVPATISISQMCESLSALDRTSLPNLFTGKTTLKHAMLDIDNPIFAVLASELRISRNNQVEHHCSTFLF
jgi:hypothetical protein